MKSNHFTFITLIACTFTIAACQSSASDSPKVENQEPPSAQANKPMRVALQQVAAQQVVKAAGVVDVPPENRVQLTSMIAGYIRNIQIIPGDRVQKGQELMRIESPNFLDLQQAYVETKAMAELAEQDYVRKQQLFDQKVVSERQLQLAKSERDQQQSRLTALSQKLPLLGFSLSRIEAGDFTPYLTIKAPETGIVNQVFLTNGQFAETNTPILSLIRPEHVHLELDVFEAEASLIQEGQQLRFRLAGQSAAKLGSVWRKGEVFRVNPVIQGQDRTLMVHAHVPDWEQPLIGAYVEAEIMVKQARFFALPEAALLKKMDAYFVQLQAKGSNEFMQLQLQLATESVQALEAVKEGYILAEFVEEIDQEVEYEILYTQN